MEGKNLIQVAVLLALVLFGVLYSYIEFFVTPLMREQEALQLKLANAKTQIASGGEQLHKLLNEEQTEQKNEALDRLLERILQTVPNTPQVDCPSILSRIMRQNGITGSRIGVSGFLPFPGIKGGILQSWSITTPQIRPVILGKAIADIENQLPMAQIDQIQIGRSPADGMIHSECSVQFATFR